MLSAPYYLSFQRIVFFLLHLSRDSLLPNHQRLYIFSPHSESLCYHLASVKFSSPWKILLHVQSHFILFTPTGIVTFMLFIGFWIIAPPFVCKHSAFSEAHTNCQDHPLYLSSIGIQIMCSVTEDFWPLHKFPFLTQFLPSP